MRKKFQTTVQASGSSDVMQLGWIAEDRLDDDMDHEKERFSALARRPETARQIQTVERTENTVVAVFECGTVKVVHWVKMERV